MGDSTENGDRVEQLTWFIVRWIAEQFQREVGKDAEFAALGLDSLDMVRLTDVLAEHLKVDELPVTLLLDYPTIPELAAHLASAHPAK